MTFRRGRKVVDFSWAGKNCTVPTLAADVLEKMAANDGYYKGPSRAEEQLLEKYDLGFQHYIEDRDYTIFDITAKGWALLLALGYGKF